MSFRPRSAAGVASLALVGLLGLSACTSTPSHRRVVLDQIEALNLPAQQETCMRGVAGTYSGDDLDNIATAGNNEDIDWNDENALASASPELQEFVERLQGCVTGDAASTATTEASDTTEAAAATDASDGTQASDTTEPVETTDG